MGLEALAPKFPDLPFIPALKSSSFFIDTIDRRKEDAMRSIVMLICAFVASLFLFTGCQTEIFTPVESKLEKNWGRAFEAAKHNQTLNPEAQKKEGPVEGLDGEAARINMDEYRNSFEKDEPEPITNFKIENMTVK